MLAQVRHSTSSRRDEHATWLEDLHACPCIRKLALARSILVLAHSKLEQARRSSRFDHHNAIGRGD